MQLFASITALMETRSAVDSLAAATTSALTPLLPPLTATTSDSTIAEAAPQGGALGRSRSHCPGASDPKSVMEELKLLDTELKRYIPLGQMLDAVSCSSMHPHAIDGQALRLAASARASPSGGAEGVDIAVLLNRWAGGLESCLPHFKTLAGTSGTAGPGSAPSYHQQGLPSFISGISAGTSGTLHPDQDRVNKGDAGTLVHPLVAPASVRGSHAALILTQLGLHKAELGHLQKMIRELGDQTAAIGAPSSPHIITNVYSA